MYEANIIIVTTKSNKEQNYADDNRAITFEEMLTIGKEITNKCDGRNYSRQNKDILLAHIKKYADYDYVRNYYQKRLVQFE